MMLGTTWARPLEQTWYIKADLDEADIESVLGGLLVDGSQRVESEIPFLSDIPLLGRLFRTSNPGAMKRNLLIMVTPTILNQN